MSKSTPKAQPLKNVICIQDDPNSTFVVHWIKTFVPNPEQFQFFRAKYVGDGLFHSNTIQMTLPCDRFPLVVTEEGIAHPALNGFNWLWSYIQSPKFKNVMTKEKLSEAQAIMTEFLEEIEFFDPNTFDEEYFRQEDAKEPKQPTQPIQTPVKPLSRVPSSNEPKTKHITKSFSSEPSNTKYKKIAESDLEDDQSENEESESHESGDSDQNASPKKPLKKTISAIEWKQKVERNKGRAVDPEIIRQNEDELADLMNHERRIKASLEDSSSKGRSKKTKEIPVPKPIPRRQKKQVESDEDDDDKSDDEEEKKVKVSKSSKKKKKKQVVIVPKKTALEWSKEKPRLRSELPAVKRIQP